MSDASENDDMISITVDGQSVQARKGQMIIEVTDEAGITIPRFCYCLLYTSPSPRDS